MFARGLLLRRAGQGGMDIFAAYAFPLTAHVICLLVGIPEADRHLFVDPATSIIPDPGFLDAAPIDAQRADVADARIQTVMSYFHDLLARERRQPQSAFIADLLAAQEVDPLFDDQILASHLFFMFFAGHQTTQSMVGNAIYHLFAGPERVEYLRRNPQRIGPAVEELTRFDSATQTGNMLLANEDVTVGGVRIPKGHYVVASLGAANRDAQGSGDAEQLDLQRAHPAHVSYGYGTHYCIGARLAAIEVRVAIECLLDLPQAMRLQQPKMEDWLPTVTLRGLKRLHATW